VVIMVIIRPNGAVIPMLTPHGEMVKWPSVREAREHFDAMKLCQIGRERIIGLHGIGQEIEL
jgi:hypothetical protein